MRIVILSMGTRGDVQPYIALGLGFQRSGHRVRIAAPEAYEAFVTSHGLDFAPLAGDPTQFIRSLVDDAGHNPLRVMRVMLDFGLPIGVEVMQRSWAACQDADVVLSSFLMLYAGHTIAHQRNLPHFSAQMFPVFTPTRAFPSPAFPIKAWGAAYNRLTHAVLTQFYRGGNEFGYRLIKKRLQGLPTTLKWPFSASVNPPTPTLYGFSPLMIPPPADWNADVHVTGYWFLDSNDGWQPPDALVHFLDAGTPPIYIGFGSMVTRDADKLTRIVVEALAKSGQRAVLAGGWGVLGADQLPESICHLDSAPHDWLFPRMAAVIHHGGAGTTGAALRASVPQLIVPFAADQPFWGDRVHRLGVGVPPIPSKQLTVDSLTNAIHSLVNDVSLRQHASQLGDRICAEDGVANAVRIVEQTVAQYAGR